MEVSELGNTQVEAPRMLFTSSYRKDYYERALKGLSVCQGKRGRGGGGQELDENGSGTASCISCLSISRGPGD